MQWWFVIWIVSYYAERIANGVVVAVESAEEAVADADVVLTATSAREPVLFKQFVKPGAHINAVGAVGLDRRELDADLVKESRIFVDSRLGALNEAGDIVKNGAENRIVAELGELAAGMVKLKDGSFHRSGVVKDGSVDKTGITVFKSLGMAIQDAVAAKLVYEKIIKGKSSLY